MAVTDDIGQNDRSEPAFHMALQNGFDAHLQLDR